MARRTGGPHVTGSGRKAIPQQLRELLNTKALEWTPELLERLRELAVQSKDLKVAHRATVSLLERLLGKPTETVVTDVSVHTMTQDMSDDDQIRYVEGVLGKLVAAKQAKQRRNGNGAAVQ